MGNLVPRYLGYGYGLVQGHVLSGPQYTVVKALGRQSAHA
jgi:hypothetical protein